MTWPMSLSCELANEIDSSEIWRICSLGNDLNDDSVSPHLGECMSEWAGGCVSELGTGRG